MTAHDEPPRLEWTGERCVPWADDVQVVYEHFHRYFFAAEFVAGKRVLDLGTGEGYGAALLGATAGTVVAIDIDEGSIEHARRHYPAPNVEFHLGSVLELDAYEDASFDVAVCFEVIEHVAEHESVVAGARRLVGAEGLLLISTPDRDVYSADGYVNPFHVRELNRPELDELLHAHFGHVVVWDQQTVSGSHVWRRGKPRAAGATRFPVRRQDDGWSLEEASPAPYLIAAASDRRLGRVSGQSSLVDGGLELVRVHERRAEELSNRVDELSGRLDELRSVEGALRREVEAANEQVARRSSERDEAAQRLAQVEREAAQRLAQVERERREKEQLADRRLRERDQARLAVAAAARRVEDEASRRVDALQARVEELDSYLNMVVGSRGWRVLEAARHARASAQRAAPSLPRARPVAPVLQTALRHQQRRATRALAPETVASAAFVGAAGRNVVLAQTAEPTVSIVIPAFNNVAVTLRCLESIAEHTPHELVEVIVVDDVSTDATPAALAQTTGVRLVRNPTNVGFLQTCNRGAAVARGRYVLFLNNDVEVEPGWLQPLLEAAEASDVGAVGSKLVYPDGTLQEAGCLIWSDGQAWNFGKGQDPDAPEFNYRREVDYCSGAALMVRRDLFERIGGFDVRYSPIYYEETDLCFAIRAEGFRVLYEPRSVVVHHEGLTHGTEEKAGVGGSEHSKTSQYRNRHVFAQKWAEALTRQRAPGTASGYLGGRIDRRSRVLVVDTWVPAHDRDSGSLRMTWILRLLRKLGCAVTLFTTDRIRREPYAGELQRAGIEVHYGHMSFSEFAAQRAGLFDLVIVSRPYVAAPLLDDVGRHFPDAVLAYDMIDAHFVREGRRAELLGKEAALDVDELRTTELECVRRSDRTIAVTDVEAQLVREHVPGAAVAVLPNVHDPPDVALPGFEERSDLVFIGGFRHDPNVDAALYLVREVLPLIRQEVDARLWILGSHPPDDVLGLASESVVVTGFLPDVSSYFEQARVFVAPLRYGAGMKGKVGHAMSFGLPVVTTTIGAEGMDLVDGKHALIRDTSDELAEAVVRAYTDRRLWETLSHGGREAVAERWTPERMELRLRSFLAQVKPRGYEHVIHETEAEAYAVPTASPRSSSAARGA